MSAECAMKLKKSVSGDEYYSSVETVNMILPYIIRGGGTKKYGVHLIKMTATL